MIKADLVIAASCTGRTNWEVVIRCGAQFVASVELPCSAATHWLSAIEIVRGSIVQDVETLLLSPEDRRGSRHLNRGDELPQKLPSCTIYDCWPAKDVLAGHAHHMARIELASVCIDKVIFQQQFMPEVDKVNSAVAEVVAVKSVKQS